MRRFDDSTFVEVENTPEGLIYSVFRIENGEYVTIKTISEKELKSDAITERIKSQ